MKYVPPPPLRTALSEEDDSRPPRMIVSREWASWFRDLARAGNEGQDTARGTLYVFQKAGTLAIESDANGPDYPVPAVLVPAAIYALVKGAPDGADIDIDITVDGLAYGSTITIADGTLASAHITAGLPSIPAASLLNYDITGVGTTDPGHDLTVVVARWP